LPSGQGCPRSPSPRLQHSKSPHLPHHA
jgi:hypothetical protein